MIMIVDLEKSLNSFEKTVEDLVERGKKLSVDVKFSEKKYLIQCIICSRQ